MALAAFIVSLVYMFYIIYGAQINVFAQQQDLCVGKECGPNGICHKIDGLCICPPGFIFVDNDPSNGCFRSPSQQNCSEQSDMKEIDNNPDWPGNDYQSIPVKTQEECKRECQWDCFCIVAIYGINGNDTPTCWKKAMPLMKGITGTQRASFVKIFQPSNEGKTSSNGEITSVSCTKDKKWMWVAISLLGCCSFMIIILVIVSSKLKKMTISVVNGSGNVEGLKGQRNRVSAGHFQLCRDS